jgi:hypothetical protein
MKLDSHLSGGRRRAGAVGERAAIRCDVAGRNGASPHAILELELEWELRRLRGGGSWKASAIERLLRAGHVIETCDSPIAARQPGAEQLAHSYDVAEPEIVLMYIEDFGGEYRAKGYEPGKRYYHDLLREEMPGFALARYWA